MSSQGSIGTRSAADLPNLPGVRRNVAAINPKLYKEFKASRGEEVSPPRTAASSRLMTASSEGSFGGDDNGSFFETLAEFNKSLSAFPPQSASFSDSQGRYSLHSQKMDRINRSRALPSHSTESLPSYGKVCNYLAYFTEETEDGEDVITRRVNIKVHCNDDQIEVVEPKVENSGTTQGKFLKKHNIMKPIADADGKKDFYRVKDFRAGCRVNFYNRIYHIVDADAFTKDYMREEGCAFGLPGTMPSTVYDPKSRPGLSRGKTAKKHKPPAKLGFFEYDRKVLRFYGVWDSRNNLFGDELKVKVHYSLADDKIEIVPIHDRNSGRDRLPKFLKKSKVNKKASHGNLNNFTMPNTANFQMSSTTSLASVDQFPLPNEHDLEGSEVGDHINIHAMGSVEGMPNIPATLGGAASMTGSQLTPGSNANIFNTVPSRPYNWKDLYIGASLEVAALSVRLLDADEFTREFYNSKMCPLDPPISLPEPVYPVVHTYIPPYNGFGSEEDSLQTCKPQLMPSGPIRDGKKLKEFQGMILRYKATIHNPKEADKSRWFILQYHLEDDTIQIREPPVRNSGHKGGIFLARCKLETHDGSEPLRPFDIYLGATVKVLSHQFDVHDADHFTFKYMEQCPNEWIYANIKLVSHTVLQKKEAVQRVILTYPSLSTRTIDVHELAEIFKKSGLDLVEQEVHTVFRAIDTYRTGSTKLSKVLKFIVDLN